MLFLWLNSSFLSIRYIIPIIDVRQSTTEIKKDILIPSIKYAVPPIKTPTMSATAKKEARLNMLS